MRWIVVVVAAAAIAGCGGEGEEPAAPDLAAAVTVATTYADPSGGAERAVDARLRVVAVHPPASELPVELPAGTAGSLADIEIVDEGAAPFPLQWASFSARTKAGKTLKEALRLSPRRVREGVRLIPVGFAVPDGDELTSVQVTSIVDVWPFDETLPVPS